MRRKDHLDSCGLSMTFPFLDLHQGRRLLAGTFRNGERAHKGGGVAGGGRRKGMPLNSTSPCRRLRESNRLPNEKAIKCFPRHACIWNLL